MDCGYVSAYLVFHPQARIMLQRRDEAYKTVDAYRLAFEEQLQKTRTMTQQLATMATTSSRAVKTKAAVKWLLSVLADGWYSSLEMNARSFWTGEVHRGY